MKTEHRHELQTNELADKLGGVIQQVKPYANLIVGVAVILAGIVIVTQLWASRNKEKQERAWSSYFMAQESPGGAESLKEVASSFAGTAASEWALQAAADRHLREGYSQLFEDRGAAAEELKAAKETYEQLLNTTSRPTLKMRAQYGLAQTEESLGSLDNALNQYKAIADAWPDSVVGKAAQEQVTRLSDPRAKDFYSWFATQKPVKRDPNVGLFNNLNNLPADPDISAPGPGELFNSTGGDDTSTAPLDLGGAEIPASTDEGSDSFDLDQLIGPGTTDESSVDVDSTAPDANSPIDTATDGDAGASAEAGSDTPAESAAEQAVDAVEEVVEETADNQ